MSNEIHASLKNRVIKSIILSISSIAYEHLRTAEQSRPSFSEITYRYPERLVFHPIEDIIFGFSNKMTYLYKFPDEFYELVIDKSSFNLTELASRTNVLVSLFRGEEHFREICTAFKVPDPEVKLKLAKEFISIGKEQLEQIKKDIIAYCLKGRDHFMDLDLEAREKLELLQKTMISDLPTGKIIFNQILEHFKVKHNGSFYEFPLTKLDLLDVTDIYIKVWRYFVISYSDLLIYHEDYLSLALFLKDHAYNLTQIQLENYVSVLHSVSVDPPLEIFASIFIQNTGSSRFENDKILPLYVKHMNSEELTSHLQYDLALAGLRNVKGKDNDWFKTFLDYYEELDGDYSFQLNYVDEEDQRAGIFNWTRWDLREKRLTLPKNHQFWDNYPVFHCENESHPLVRAFQRYNKVKVSIKDHIRELLKLPPVGGTKINETRVYNNLVTMFPTLKIEREQSPGFLAPQRYDFYIPELKIAIEWNGEQHYYPVELFGGNDGFDRTIERDEMKRMKSEANGVVLIELKYDMTDEEIEEEVKVIELILYSLSAIK